MLCTAVTLAVMNFHNPELEVSVVLADVYF
jgi:hypothetical protein